MSNCSICKKPFTRGRFTPSEGWICEDCLGVRIVSQKEWITDQMKKERGIHAKDMVQPFRGGEFSREFAKLYPDQTKKMIDGGSVTKDRVIKSKNVWNDIKDVKKLNL